MKSCTSCHRFVTFEERSCPFCGATVRCAPSKALTLGMSLLLGFGIAGCDDDKDNSTDETTMSETANIESTTDESTTESTTNDTTGSVMTTGNDDSSAAGVTYGAAPPLEEPLPGWELAPDKGEDGKDDFADFKADGDEEQASGEREDLEVAAASDDEELGNDRVEVN